METQENTNQTPEKNGNPFNSGRAMAGGILLIVGSVLLARQAGADLPEWMFTWPMIPIVVGIFLGAKHGFREWGWLIPVTVGVLFLINYNVEGLSFHQLWPVIIIVVGVTMLLDSGKRRRKRCM